MSITVQTFCEYLIRSIDCGYESRDETFISVRHLEKFLEHAKLLSSDDRVSSEDLGSKLVKLAERNDRLEKDKEYFKRENARMSAYLEGVEELKVNLEVPEGMSEGSTRELLEAQIVCHIRDKISFTTEQRLSGNVCKAQITLLIQKNKGSCIKG